MEKHKRRIYNIIQLGQVGDVPSKSFDIFIAVCVILNLFSTLFSTFDESLPYKKILFAIEAITIIVFTVEYILRIWTAEYMFPKKTPKEAKLAYILSFFGIIDFLTILPFYLPTSFTTGMVAFRMVRVARIFQLFKANKYTNSFNVITEVLKEKKDQILSSVFMVLILMVASSLCMYSVENAAQPEVFKNAFSGIWWSVSTLLTVGYGDIYPITAAGKILAIIISFLGVGMVAIPTGIISAGFVEQYTKAKTKEMYMDETNFRFVVIKINSDHNFVNKLIKELNLPQGLIIAAVIRDDEAILPKGDMKLEIGDKLVLAAEAYKDDVGITLKEVTIKEHHPWVGEKIKNLDISRQTLIIVIKRRNKVVIPHGDITLRANDVLMVYSKKDISEIMDGINVDL